MTPQAVIFDIGRVLIDWQPEAYYDRTFGTETRRRLFADVDLYAMNDDIDMGADFQERVRDTADAHPEWREHILHWHDHWLDFTAPGFPGSVQLLRALRAQGTPVFALTNFGIGTWNIAAAAYPFLMEFDRHYISGHMKMVKPDPGIYAQVEADCGIDPAALLFTDDREDNIAAAADRGWQTHLFAGSQGWADCLVSHGLLKREGAA